MKAMIATIVGKLRSPQTRTTITVGALLAALGIAGTSVGFTLQAEDRVAKIAASELSLPLGRVEKDIAVLSTNVSALVKSVEQIDTRLTRLEEKIVGLEVSLGETRVEVYNIKSSIARISR